MKFTLTIPNPIFEGCQRLAREHDVRVATILNALIRRGIICGHVCPFVLLHDEYQFKRELQAEIKRLDRVLDEWDGLDLEAMTGDEVAAIANGERSLDEYPPDPLELLAESLDDEGLWGEPPTKEAIMETLESFRESTIMLAQAIGQLSDDDDDC
jgi:hypothetical protein